MFEKLLRIRALEKPRVKPLSLTLVIAGTFLAALPLLIHWRMTVEIADLLRAHGEAKVDLDGPAAGIVYGCFILGGLMIAAGMGIGLSRRQQ